MTPISDGVTPMNTPDALTIQTRHTGQLGGARPGAGRPVKPWEGPSETPEELAAYRDRVVGHAREYLDSLSDYELLTLREMNIDGETLVYSPADIFAHTLLHERQHHGDVHTLLYQLGIEVPIVEYRFSLPERQA